ncbi:GntR family transcriptional regulator [uncultured Holdemanella sp.]|uniref:GntR family transcriptional regulator n=1 Tax=uncultured Holdemanella sp. TaxID=1763549 RepID=UPI002804A90E|nr:GntR family transcriptional regulator [uncultured Holdemanella sp.]
MHKLDTTSGHLPYYKQIKEFYKEDIQNGVLSLGDRVDSEMEIQQIYDVSRITARQAILELEQEGMVKRGRGKGTFVTFRPKIKEELSHIRSFTDEMIALGRVPGTQAFHITKEIPDDETRALFGLPEEMMYCVRRVRTADDVLLVYFVSYFPLGLDLPLDLQEHTQSVYEAIGSPVRIDEEFSAMNPSEEVCLALKIRKDQPVLVRKRVSFDEKERKMEYTMCYYRGDLYSYTISTSQKL